MKIRCVCACGPRLIHSHCVKEKLCVRVCVCVCRSLGRRIMANECLVDLHSHCSLTLLFNRVFARCQGPTIGVDFKSKLMDVNGNKVKLTIW
jgi:hypothetical protein